MGKVQKIGELFNDKSMKIIEVSHKRNNNDKSMKVIEAKVGYTEYLADKLVEIYNAPTSRNFFLKCAWHLPEDIIWTAVENSRKKAVRSPIKYFVAICNRALRERPAIA